MEYAKQKLIDYLENYNNRRIKAKLKGHLLQSKGSKPFWLLERYYALLRRLRRNLSSTPVTMPSAPAATSAAADSFIWASSQRS